MVAFPGGALLGWAQPCVSASAVAAYVFTLLFALAHRWHPLGRHLLIPPPTHPA